MGIWKEIGKALNSTLGTSNFKPLDQIIEGQRTLAASDSVIKVLNITPKYGTSASTPTFASKVNGSVRFLLDLQTREDTLVDVTVEMYNADTDLRVSSAVRHLVVDEDTDFIISLDASVVKGENYYFTAHSTEYVTFNAGKIGANVVDTNLIEIGGA